MATSTANGRQAHDPAGDVIMSNEIMSSSDLLPPDIQAETFMPYGDEGKDYFMMRNMGFEQEVTQEDYSHFEQGLTTTRVIVDNAAAGAGGAITDTVTYTVSNSAGNSTSGTTVGTIFPRVGEIVMFSNTGNATGMVSATTDPTATVDGDFTVVPINGVTLPAVTSGGTISATVAENEIIIWTGSSGEASGVIDPAIIYWEKYSNNVQIIKEKVSQTGTALSNAAYVTTPKNGKGVWYANLTAGERRLYKKMDGAWMHGTGQSSMTGIIDASSAVNGEYTLTKGLIPTIEERGIVSAASGTFTISDFNDWSGDLEAEYVPVNTPVWTKMGKVFADTVEDTIVDSYGVNTDAFIESAINKTLYKKEVKALNVGFKYIQKSSRYFMLENHLAWSDPNTYGAKGFTFNEMALMIPVKTSRRVKGEGVKIGTVGVRYKAINGYSRRMKVGRLSGFGSTIENEPITSETDLTKFMWLTHFGAEFAEVNSMIKITL